MKENHFVITAWYTSVIRPLHSCYMLFTAVREVIILVTATRETRRSFLRQWPFTRIPALSCTLRRLSSPTQLVHDLATKLSFYLTSRLPAALVPHPTHLPRTINLYSLVTPSSVRPCPTSNWLCCTDDACSCIPSIHSVGQTLT